MGFHPVFITICALSTARGVNFAIKEVLDFLTVNKVFYLATSNQKDMYKQLVATPNMELCCVDANCNTLRICGKAVFCTTGETQRKALELMPTLGKIYAVGDGKFEIFCLANAQAVCQAMSGEKQILTV